MPSSKDLRNLPEAKVTPEEMETLIALLDDICLGPSPIDSERALQRTWRESFVPPSPPAVKLVAVDASDPQPETGAEVVEVFPKEQAPEGSTSVQPGKRLSREQYNVLAIEHLKKYGKDHKVTVSELMDAIGCGRGTVPKLAAWRAYQDEWNRRNPPKNRGRKAVSLTGKVEAVTGLEDETLSRLESEEQRELERQRLIAESEADNRRDPSPVDDDPPGRSRRVRERKTV